MKRLYILFIILSIFTQLHAQVFEAEDMQDEFGTIGRFETYIAFYDTSAVSFTLEKSVVDAMIKVYAKEDAFPSAHAILAIQSQDFYRSKLIQTEYWDTYYISAGNMSTGTYTLGFINDDSNDTADLNLYIDYIEIIGQDIPAIELDVYKDFLLYWLSDSIRLHWDENTEPDLDFYRIYRMSQDTVYFDSIDNEFIDTPLNFDSTFYYGVTAVDSSGNESGMSKGVKVVRVKPIVADYDRSLVVDFDDFVDFVSVYKSDNSYYDLDNVPPVNFDDFVLFVGAYKSQVVHPILESDKLTILTKNVN